MHSSPESTLVIILGAANFPKLPEHMSKPAFRNSAREFRLYLLDKEGFGLANQNLLDLFDCPAGPLEQDEKIVQFLKRRIRELRTARTPATDLLVYYVGHGGFFPPHDQYFLTLSSTKEGNEAISGYPMHVLAVTLKEHTPLLRHYLILDCCFSAAANKSFQGSAPMDVARKKTEEELPAKGTALLCAASPWDPAKAPPGHANTMFSGVLLEVLWKGSPELPERLSLAQVGKCTEDLIRVRFAGMGVRPEVHSPDQQKGDLARFGLFPNHGLAAKALAAPQPPPEAILVGQPPGTSQANTQGQIGGIPWWRRSPVAVRVGAAFMLVAVLLAVAYATGILGPQDITERVRRSVKPKASKGSKVVGFEADGKPKYENCFWIEGPPDIMDQIETVVYRIPGYPDYRPLNPRPREDGFKSCYLGIGPWAGSDTDVVIVLRNDKVVTLKFNMSEAVYGK
jgi:hypothetical protein